MQFVLFFSLGRSHHFQVCFQVWRNEKRMKIVRVENLWQIKVYYRLRVTRALGAITAPRFLGHYGPRCAGNMELLYTNSLVDPYLYILLSYLWGGYYIFSYFHCYFYFKIIAKSMRLHQNTQNILKLASQNCFEVSYSTLKCFVSQVHFFTFFMASQ